MAKASSDLREAALPAAASYVDLMAFGRDTIAAAVGSNTVLGAGIEALGQAIAQDARAAFASAGETARGLLAARTFEDVARLQIDFAKRSFEGFVARSMKLTELGCSLFGASVGAGSAQGMSARAKS